jgi:hypothetical protein
MSGLTMPSVPTIRIAASKRVTKRESKNLTATPLRL